MASAFVAMLASVAVIRTAASAEDPAGVVQAKKFWAAIADGDPKALKDFYATRVTMHPGCELLKEQWAVKGVSDRTKPASVSREDLIAAHQRLIEKAGREKWRKVFGRVPAERIVVSGTLTSAESLKLKINPGDLVLKVTPVEGKNDVLFYVFRSVGTGKTRSWQLVAELTDY